MGSKFLQHNRIQSRESEATMLALAHLWVALDSESLTPLFGVLAAECVKRGIHADSAGQQLAQYIRDAEAAAERMR